MIDTQTKLYLVLELGDGGDMYDYIMKHEGGLGEDMARKYFRQIVTAIQYCHKLHVVHRCVRATLKSTKDKLVQTPGVHEWKKLFKNCQISYFITEE